jgi:ankyrin repeat protein
VENRSAGVVQKKIPQFKALRQNHYISKGYEMKKINLKVVIYAFAGLLIIMADGVFAQSAEDWVPVRRGEIPENAVPGGYEEGGSKTFVCRTRYGDGYIGGKALDGVCFYNPGDRERSSNRFEVLVGSVYEWKRTSSFERAVAVGGTQDENFYVCRVGKDGGIYPGRTENGRCYYTSNRRGYSSTGYEVLIGDRYNINLLSAASTGNFQAVRDALRGGQAINQTDSSGKTALMLAAEKGYEPVIRELLYERADFDLRDRSGSTALMLASANGHTDIVRNLRREGATISIRNNADETAFTLAAAGGHTQLIDYFLSSEDYEHADPSEIEKGFRNAAANGHSTVLRSLLDYGVSVESPDVSGRTALMLAAGNGRIDTVRFLLQMDAAPEVRDDRGWTPFIYAVESNSVDVLQVFWEERELVGPDDAEAVGGLHLAAANNRRKSLQYLLQKGVDVDAPGQTDGSTALMLASAEGHDEAAEIILKSSPDLNARNSRGETALILAAARSKNNTTKLLLEAGADMNIRDNTGRTALAWAIENKHGDTRKTLQKAGAKQ